MHIIFLATCFSIISLHAIAQESKLQFENPRFSEIQSIEQTEGGRKYTYSFAISVSKNYFPNSDNFNLAAPVIYFRNTYPLKTEVDYFYSLPDSIVRLKEYTWNSSNSTIDSLKVLFEKNKETISTYLKDNGTTTFEDHTTWTQKTIIWENETTYVKQFMVIGSSTYRVRVLVSWK